jgi:RHS repeat-associated protein
MSFAYDAFGNQSERRGSGVVAGRLRIEYTSFDLPLLATLGEDADPNKRTLAYRYDASGARTSSAIEGGERITYVGERYRITRTATGEIEYAALIPSPEAIETEVVLQPGGVRRYRFGHANYQGSIVAVTGDEGKADEQRDWTRFGALRALSGRSGMRSGFTGHEQDSATGLINMRGRVYDAHTGRFLSADAIVQAPGLADSWNRYSYALNRPTALVDPTGFQSKEFGATARVPQGDSEGPTGYVMLPPINLPPLLQGVTAPVAPSGTPGPGVSVNPGSMVLSNEWDDGDEICVAVNCDQLARDELFEFLFGDVAYFVAEQVAIAGALKSAGMALQLSGELALRGIGYLSLVRGPPRLTIGLRLQRFFITPVRYVGVRASPVGRFLTNRFPRLRLQQHHLVIQQRWWNGAAASRLFSDPVATRGLARLGNAGWNLLPIPGALNRWLGRSEVGTAFFGSAVYQSLYQTGRKAYRETSEALGGQHE